MRFFFHVHGDVVGAVLFKFAQILVHAAHDLIIVLLGDGGIVHVPQGQLLGQDLEKRVVLIGHDGLVDAALGKGPGGDDLPMVQLRQPRHAMAQAVGEDQALHLVILADAVVAPGGVEHPVADVYQVQQAPELFFCQLDLHENTSIRPERCVIMHSIADSGGKYH